jgi:hypothetical protein
MVKGTVTVVWYKILWNGDRLKPLIPIHENYGAYKPNKNVRRIVENLLASIDPQYLQGLGSIVLSSQAGLSRKRRRKKFVSRGRKVPTPHVQAYYRQCWKGQPAFIEIYIDTVLAPIPGWFARLPIVGFMAIGKVLFHELGHHIHLTTRPEFKEKEEGADQWRRRLMKTAFLKRYKYAVRFLRPAVKLAKPVIDKIAHYRDKHQLKQSRDG